MPDRVIVVGAGAIGAPIGGLLHERGVDVVVVARGEHGRAMAAAGLDLRTPAGGRVLRPPVVAALADARPADRDLVLLTVMGQDTRAALVGLPSTVPVASLQNGLEPLDVLVEHGNPLIAGMVYVPAERRAPGVVALSGEPHFGSFLLGSWATAPVAEAGWLAGALGSVGFRAEVVGEMGPWIRAKLLANLGGILVALCDAPPSEVLALAVAEARSVWDAAGDPYFTAEALVERIGGLRSAPVDGLVRVGGSTRHALGRGQALETRSLHGPIVALGARLGVSTPVNAALIALAERAVAEGWQPGQLAPDQLRSLVISG